MRMGFLVAAMTAVAVPAFAQDAVTVDPKHYKVEFENDHVRVLRITYGPGEASVMHEHPENVAVFLTDGQGKFTLPDGSTQDASFPAGSVQWGPGETHLPQNVGEEPFELILIELKGAAAPATTASTR
ncbi:MAG TPA: cupin domain-containing protein [Gemmatimonadota bacterium]|jgi:quercetin dioxygenase-like cupin family protein